MHAQTAAHAYTHSSHTCNFHYIPDEGYIPEWIIIIKSWESIYSWSCPDTQAHTITHFFPWRETHNHNSLSQKEHWHQIHVAPEADRVSLSYPYNSSQSGLYSQLSAFVCVFVCLPFWLTRIKNYSPLFYSSPRVSRRPCTNKILFAGTKEAKKQRVAFVRGIQMTRIETEKERGKKWYTNSHSVSLNIQKPLKMNTSISISSENVINNKTQIHCIPSQVVFTKPECPHASLTKQWVGAACSCISEVNNWKGWKVVSEETSLLLN